MAFMDSMNPDQQGGGMGAPGGAVQSQGSMGLTSRPKQRFIDKILMRRQDKETQAVNSAVQGLQTSQVSAARMGSGPGSVFGGGRQ